MTDEDNKPEDISLHDVQIHDERPEGERAVSALVMLCGGSIEIADACLTITDGGEDLDMRVRHDMLAMAGVEDTDRFEDAARAIVRDELWEIGDRAGLPEPLRRYAVMLACYVEVTARNAEHAEEQVSKFLADRDIWLDLNGNVNATALEIEDATAEIED